MYKESNNHQKQTHDNYQVPAIGFFKTMIITTARTMGRTMARTTARTTLIIAAITMACILFTGCGEAKQEPFDPATSSYIKESTPIEFDIETLNAIPDNPNPTLSVPTYITKVNDTYFIVDCYHNQVIYHDNLTDPLYEWQIMVSGLGMPHTLASDGTLYVIDDTENNRILIMEEGQNLNGMKAYLPTQEFTGMGNRPHYIIYNEEDRTFYVWSSQSGEMFLLKRAENDNTLYWTNTYKIDSLDGIYVRSFTIQGNSVYFVSGDSKIIEASLTDFKIKKEYPVPDSMAGMVQMTRIEDYWYLTISTDKMGSQDAATILRVKNLSDLMNGSYEDIYANFVGGGTPYYITKIEDTYYLTEHRLPGHSIWSFQVDENNELKNVTTIY